jgi:hypothetical protein
LSEWRDETAVPGSRRFPQTVEHVALATAAKQVLSRPPDHRLMSTCHRGHDYGFPGCDRLAATATIRP